MSREGTTVKDVDEPTTSYTPFTQTGGAATAVPAERDGAQVMVAPPREEVRRDGASTTGQKVAACVITYGGNAVVGQSTARGFTPAQPLNGTATPNAQSGPLLVVTTSWNDFAISAERNFVNTMADLVSGLAGAVAAAGTGRVRDAIKAAIDSLQPLMHGRLMTYMCDVSWSFTCAATEDGARFPIRHSAAYGAGITSAGGQTEMTWALSVDAQVDGPRPELALRASSATATAREYDLRNEVAPAAGAPFTVGVGAHMVKQRALLSLRVTGFGAEFDNLLQTLRSVWNTLGALDPIVDSMFTGNSVPDSVKQQMKDALLQGLKEVAKQSLEQIKALLTNVTGAIALNETILSVDCPPAHGAGKDTGH